VPASSGEVRAYGKRGEEATWQEEISKKNVDDCALEGRREKGADGSPHA